MEAIRRASSRVSSPSQSSAATQSLRATDGLILQAMASGSISILAPVSSAAQAMLWPDWRSANTWPHYRSSALIGHGICPADPPAHASGAAALLCPRSRRAPSASPVSSAWLARIAGRDFGNIFYTGRQFKKPDTPSAARSAQARVQGGTRNEDAHVVTHTATPERAAAPDTGYIRHCAKQRLACVPPKGLTQPLQRWRPW